MRNTPAPHPLNDEEIVMSQTTQERNKAVVLEAFDTLFNKRDYVAAERYWSPTYIQHSAHIAPGREGLFNLIKSMPPTLKYEPGMIVADGDLVLAWIPTGGETTNKTVRRNTDINRQNCVSFRLYTTLRQGACMRLAKDEPQSLAA
jgi:predicted SnoaL-like aldol condensation-catalyzing enzyme